METVTVHTGTKCSGYIGGTWGHRKDSAWTFHSSEILGTMRALSTLSLTQIGDRIASMKYGACLWLAPSEFRSVEATLRPSLSSSVKEAAPISPRKEINRCVDCV